MEVLINATRAILAVLTIAVLPGYTLIYLLFPTELTKCANSQLDVLERFYLTVLSSVAITSLIAFALSRTEAGLTAQALILGISLFVAFCLLAAWLRSWTLAEKSAPSELKRTGKRASGRVGARVGNWLLLGTSLFVIISAVIGLSTTDQSLGLTEFYITPEYLSRQGVEYSMVNDSLVVPVGITNKEGQQMSYRLESWLDGEQVTVQGSIVVNDGERWNGTVLLPLQALGNAQFVEIKLFWQAVRLKQVKHRPQKSTPVAQLRLWLSPEPMNGN